MLPTDQLSLKIRIVKIGLASRLAIVFAACWLASKGGFVPRTRRELLYILLPLSSFYIIMLGSFIFKQAYRITGKGKSLSLNYVSWAYYLLWFLNICEFTLMIWQASAPFLAEDVFLQAIMLTEVGFALFAGRYIADLFKIST